MARYMRVAVVCLVSLAFGLGCGEKGSNIPTSAVKDTKDLKGKEAPKPPDMITK